MRRDYGRDSVGWSSVQCCLCLYGLLHLLLNQLSIVMLYEFLSFCCVLALMSLVQLALADSRIDSIKYGLRAIVNLAARNDANQAQLEALGVYKGL